MFYCGNHVHTLSHFLCHRPYYIEPHIYWNHWSKTKSRPSAKTDAFTVVNSISRWEEAGHPQKAFSGSRFLKAPQQSCWTPAEHRLAPGGRSERQTRQGHPQRLKVLFEKIFLVSVLHFKMYLCWQLLTFPYIFVYKYRYFIHLTFSNQFRYLSLNLYLVELSILFIGIERLFSFPGYHVQQRKNSARIFGIRISPFEFEQPEFYSILFCFLFFSSFTNVTTLLVMATFTVMSEPILLHFNLS